MPMYFGRKLLMMALLGLSATGASAEIVDGVRQQPLPLKSSLAYNTEMYLFNAGAKKFFVGGEPYGTRAQLADTPWQVTIVDNGDGTVLLKDRVETKNNAVMCTFADGWDSDDEDELPDGNVWVDNDGHDGRFWKITTVGDDIYNIQIAPSVSYAGTWPNTFLGVKKGGADALLYWNLTAEEGDVNWYFVNMSDIDAYNTLLSAFKAAESLKAVIDEAKVNGIDVAEEEKVYLDESASVETINDAIASVKQKLAAAEEGKVTADNPVDKTSLIVNPSYDSNNNTGWSGDAPAFQSYTDAEFYKKKFNTYQNITGAPKGVYALNVQAFYRSGFSNVAYENYINMTQYDAKLYAEADGEKVQVDIVNPWSEPLTEPLGMKELSVEIDGVPHYIPDDMQTAEEYFKLGKYNNKVFFATEDGDMTIGMMKDNSDTPDGNWVLYDNWGLTYYGNGADAYTMWLDEAKKAAKDYSGLSEDVLVTNGVIDAYNDAIAGLTIANSKADVLAAINTINEEVAKVDANIAAWKEYKDILDKAAVIANDEQIGGSDKDELADYIGFESEDIIGELALSTEEVYAEIEKVKTMYDNAIKNGIKEGTDVTDKYLVNADFETTDKGWIVEKASGGNVAYGGTSTNKCFEAWNNSKFDIYQEVADAPIGVYEISVQGFYRYGRGATAYEAYQNGTAPNDAVNIYVNNNNAHFKSVFDEPVANGELYTGGTYVDPNEEYWYPNDMATGSEAFANGMYVATSFGVVANAGDVLRIGVKGATNQLGDSWAIWDNFKMVFQGTKAEIVQPLLSDAIFSMQEAIINANRVGKSTLEAANIILDGANAAISSNDGKAMFTSLCEIIDAKNSLIESASLFTKLVQKNEDLNLAWMNSAATEVVKSEAANLFTEINNGIENNTLNNEDAEAYIAAIDKMIIKLAIPADAENASDDHPVYLTTLIQTPNFEKDGANSIEGWNADGYSFGNNDTQKSALLVEFFGKAFDLNQTIVGLPNGTYKVSVNAFYRFGSTAEDWAKYSEDPNTQGNAYLYATSGAETNQTSIALLSSGACEDNGYGGTSNIEGTEFYVPNDMVSANLYFQDLDAYKNDVIVKVVDNELTIGIKLAEENVVNNNWVILDNWTLTYYGENSNIGTGVEGVEVAEPAKVEIYNVNGMKTKGFSKGVNIVKMTSKDGAVKFSKVNIK